jgi:hypothetical protein
MPKGHGFLQRNKIIDTDGFFTTKGLNRIKKYLVIHKAEVDPKKR